MCENKLNFRNVKIQQNNIQLVLKSYPSTHQFFLKKLYFPNTLEDVKQAYDFLLQKTTQIFHKLIKTTQPKNIKFLNFKKDSNLYSIFQKMSGIIPNESQKITFE